jgi:hypothetical protein
MKRRALYVADGEAHLAEESRFADEITLQDAISQRPEVLPYEQLGLGRLTTLAMEYPCRGLWIDLVLMDEFGRLAVCEVKKGSENADVRRVIAQMLDYGAALWQTDLDEFERTVSECEPRKGESLTGVVTEAVRARIGQCLAEGDFVFLYVVRDVDVRTERVVEYLAAQRKMPLFVVEVDHFKVGSASMMVPRAVGVPSWVADPSTPVGPVGDPDADELMAHMDELATSLKIDVKRAETGKRYNSRVADAYIGVYRTTRGMEFGLAGLIDSGHADLAGQVREAIRSSGLKITDSVKWPLYRCHDILDRWPVLSSTAFPLFLIGSTLGQADSPTSDRYDQ